jgi:hypothetical protein
MRAGMNRRFPIFIPTKGRFETPYTIRAFEDIGVPFHPVVQPQEYHSYAAAVKDPSRIIVLPSGLDGLVPTRNWIWDYAQSLGVSYFWTFDDNIKCFHRLHQNKRIKLGDGAFLEAIEDWVQRYENMAITGMHYTMFAVTQLTKTRPPLLLNTRVYSNMFIKTDIPYRNQGIYNDDTDLCLRVLKDGWCTALFYAFLIDKLTTMTVKGGNTPIYQGDGRLKMAQELQQRHPDVTKITWKWGRWQHHVDYRPFKNNRPILRPGIVIPDEPNNYGMVLKRRGEATTSEEETQS